MLEGAGAACTGGRPCHPLPGEYSSGLAALGSGSSSVGSALCYLCVLKLSHPHPAPRPAVTLAKSGLVATAGQSAPKLARGARPRVWPWMGGVSVVPLPGSTVPAVPGLPMGAENWTCPHAGCGLVAPPRRFLTRQGTPLSITSRPLGRAGAQRGGAFCHRPRGRAVAGAHTTTQQLKPSVQTSEPLSGPGLGLGCCCGSRRLAHPWCTRSVCWRVLTLPCPAPPNRRGAGPTGPASLHRPNSLGPAPLWA